MIIIGGDDEYRDENEEEQVVISRWARRKVESQFDKEYLDGRKSFIFSWNKSHREIHEEALKQTSTQVGKEKSSSMCQNKSQQPFLHQSMILQTRFDRFLSLFV